MIRFGGPVFEANDDPRVTAKAYKNKGYTAAYVPPVELNDKHRIKEIKEAFKAENIILSEVGYWENIRDTNEEIRKKNMDNLVNALYLAEELGACCAVDIFGLYGTGSGPKFVAENFSDHAFAEAVDVARYIIDTVKPETAYFTYEIFPFNVVDSPESIDKMLKAVDRKQFGVHLDLCNLINSPRAFFASGDIMRDCTKRFGDKIVAAHAKDLKLHEPAMSVMIEEVIPGTGRIDIHTFLRELHKLPQDIPVMMEHLSTEEEYDTAAAHIRKCAKEEGIEI